jgi:hypothetical protein
MNPRVNAFAPQHMALICVLVAILSAQLLTCWNFHLPEVLGSYALDLTPGEKSLSSSNDKIINFYTYQNNL